MSGSLVLPSNVEHVQCLSVGSLLGGNFDTRKEAFCPPTPPPPCSHRPLPAPLRPPTPLTSSDIPPPPPNVQKEEAGPHLTGPIFIHPPPNP